MHFLMLIAKAFRIMFTYSTQICAQNAAIQANNDYELFTAQNYLETRIFHHGVNANR